MRAAVIMAGGVALVALGMIGLFYRVEYSGGCMFVGLLVVADQAL